VGEDRPVAVNAGVEGQDLPLRREGQLFREGGRGGVAASADQGSPAGGKGFGAGRGLELVEAAGRQTAGFDGAAAVEGDRDPAQGRRARPGEGLDRAGDADGDRGAGVARQGVGSDGAAEADEEVAALGQLGPRG
jgi:hypothetical protein